MLIITIFVNQVSVWSWWH